MLATQHGYDYFLWPYGSPVVQLLINGDDFDGSDFHIFPWPLCMVEVGPD